MPIWTPKEFIKIVLINELQLIVETRPYHSFLLIASGIEFLGKAIHPEHGDWDLKNKSRQTFKFALKNIPSLKKYHSIENTYNLYDSLRCGMAHGFAPKGKVTLSCKEQKPHLQEDHGRINLKIEEFYRDFVEACQYVTNIDFPPKNKMNMGFLEVPE